MRYTVFNEEVLFSSDAITRLDQTDIALLKARALANRRHRIRLCAHPNTADRLHEMIIVQAQGVYVRPHKHLGKSESFHIIEGQLEVVIFEDHGQVKEVIRMGAAGSGQIFFYRLSPGWFHTVVPRSRLVVFHETTNGPFKPAETVFAPWAPTHHDGDAQRRDVTAWCTVLDPLDAAENGAEFTIQ